MPDARACLRSCGRQIYTVAPLESLFAEERRCPRCGAFLDDDRRDTERRLTNRRQNPPDDPGPPATTDGRTARGTGAPAVAAAAAAAPTTGDRPPGNDPAGSTDLGRPIGRRADAMRSFLGFGLIAGSIARALVRAGRSTAGRWSAWSPTGRGAARRAVDDGVLDRAAIERPGDASRARTSSSSPAPATDCLDLLDALAGPWRAVAGPQARS